LYWARLSWYGSTTLAKARFTMDAVRSRAIVASCAVDRNGLVCRISLWTALDLLRLGCLRLATVGIGERLNCSSNTCYDNYYPFGVKPRLPLSTTAARHHSVEVSRS